MADTLKSIEVFDARDGGPAQHALAAADRVRALSRECASWTPFSLALLLMPGLDRFARRWFRRSCSPYVGELEAITAALGFSGIWFLNGAYQWGCTSLARDHSRLAVSGHGARHRRGASARARG
jgi:hypothetical protein